MQRRGGVHRRRLFLQPPGRHVLTGRALERHHLDPSARARPARPHSRWTRCPAPRTRTAPRWVRPRSGLLAEQWNGTTWTPQTMPLPSGYDFVLNGVSCSSATACTAVGSYTSSAQLVGLTERWNGTTWAVSYPGEGVGPVQRLVRFGDDLHRGRRALQLPRRNLPAGRAMDQRPLAGAASTRPHGQRLQQPVRGVLPYSRDCVAVGGYVTMPWSRCHWPWPERHCLDGAGHRGGWQAQQRAGRRVVPLALGLHRGR